VRLIGKPSLPKTHFRRNSKGGAVANEKCKMSPLAAGRTLRGLKPHARMESTHTGTGRSWRRRSP
jgi:hypothetical protein